MSDSEKMSVVNSNLATNDFSKFEQFLAAYGLPYDNVIAPIEERQILLQALPQFLNSLPPEMKKDARYLSKFIAGSAIGLFDASLNFVWNEVVLNLRKKIIAYGLDYFFDNAVGARVREFYQSEADLPQIKDQVLLDTCKKLELIPDLLHRKLCHILDMRNQIGSSHPNEYAINSYELLGWLSTCIKDVFMAPVSESALTIKGLIDNAKSFSTPIDDSYLSQFENCIKNLSSTMVANLLTNLFGIYVSPANKSENLMRHNIMQLARISWKYCVDRAKYSLGEKIDSYRANLDEYKTSQAEQFFVNCNGQRYFTTDSRAMKLTLLCEQLTNVHYGWDNYLNEQPVAQEIMNIITVPTDIPENRLETVFMTFLICRIGNDRYYYQGVSPYAKNYYDSLFNMVDERLCLLVLSILKANEQLLSGQYRPIHVKSICAIMRSSTLSDRCYEMLDYITNFTGRLDSVFRMKDFKDIAMGRI